MKNIESVLKYLKKNDLILTTAESCTGGKIIQLLSRIPKSGESLDTGYVVYSADAKKIVLGVQQKTIDRFTLTSEEVARQMVVGALKKSASNVVVATTGIAGSQPMDGVDPGTVCFGWGFQDGAKQQIFSDTHKFNGTRIQVIANAAAYVLKKIPFYHKKFIIKKTDNHNSS